MKRILLIVLALCLASMLFCQNFVQTIHGAPTTNHGIGVHTGFDGYDITIGNVHGQRLWFQIYSVFPECGMIINIDGNNPTNPNYELRFSEIGDSISHVNGDAAHVMPFQHGTYRITQEPIIVNAGDTAVGQYYKVERLTDCELCGVSDGLLPVEYSDFRVDYNHIDKTVNLNWTTLTEIENAGFEIQRSVDGINYEVVGWVDGNGNSTVENRYYFPDVVENAGVYYYQLNQIDFNGDSELSKSVPVKIQYNDRGTIERFTILGEIITDIEFFNGDLYIECDRNYCTLEFNK